MASKKETSKKGGFALAPITLAQPIKVTDGFTNLVETHSSDTKAEKTVVPPERQGSGSETTTTKKPETETKLEESVIKQTTASTKNVADAGNDRREHLTKTGNNESSTSEDSSSDFALTENELLKILDADSLDEIYELTDILRASSLKLYSALIRLADSRGRARVKNHELMSKAGIKGIATLYKQERWLMDLKLLEKKAKPGPHDGSSYVVHKLDILPLPAEIYEKFDEYLSNQK
jgi:hypothetical protein